MSRFSSYAIEFVYNNDKLYSQMIGKRFTYLFLRQLKHTKGTSTALEVEYSDMTKFGVWASFVSCSIHFKSPVIKALCGTNMYRSHLFLTYSPLQPIHTCTICHYHHYVCQFYREYYYTNQLIYSEVICVTSGKPHNQPQLKLYSLRTEYLVNMLRKGPHHGKTL